MKKIVAITLSMLLFASCSGSSDESSSSIDGPVTLTLLAHDSFTPSEGIFDAFTAETGITVNIVRSGDAGELVSKAALTSGNPEGDVLWGVDNTLLSRALDADMFESYQTPNLAFMNESLMRNIPGHEVTPVDTGDVCINYDIAWFAENNIAPPMTLDALINSPYANLLVLPSAITSSPGLAFFLATVAEFGEDGWQDYWKALRENGVLVVDGWTQAYSTEFSGSSGKGERPIVVSYSSSPAAEVLFADPPTDVAPTGVAPLTCFEQIEYAGILRGTKHKAEAQLLIDYLTGTTFQSDLPLTQFVFPVHADATIPESFTRYISRPERALTIEYNVIAENRAVWLDEWSTIVFK
ncbi:thiamine ABC transporter substrate-binding protein [Actinomycetes bacterium]|nr:thiamine ABC transporter substrate-binding protein [Actinomycetes bacterium]